MKNDLLASIDSNSSALEQAAKRVLREALDAENVHPCDVGDDAVAVRRLPENMQALFIAVTGKPIPDLS